MLSLYCVIKQKRTYRETGLTCRWRLPFSGRKPVGPGLPYQVGSWGWRERWPESDAWVESGLSGRPPSFAGLREWLLGGGRCTAAGQAVWAEQVAAGSVASLKAREGPLTHCLCWQRPWRFHFGGEQGAIPFGTQKSELVPSNATFPLPYAPSLLLS